MSYLSQRPLEGECIPYFFNYINQVPQDIDIVNHLEEQRQEQINFLHTIPIEKHDFNYQEGKWTVKEVVQHLSDCERIFCYRALRIARYDKTPLAGFDENEYIENCDVHHRNFEDMIQEFDSIRQASISLFKSLQEKHFTLQGIANNKPISVRAIAFIVAGHTSHHIHVLKERYL